MHPFTIEKVDARDIEYRLGRDGALVEVKDRKTGEVWRTSGPIGESRKGRGL